MSGEWVRGRDTLTESCHSREKCLISFSVATMFRVREGGEQENSVILWNHNFTDDLPMTSFLSPWGGTYFFKQARQLTGNQVGDETTTSVFSEFSITGGN